MAGTSYTLSATEVAINAKTLVAGAANFDTITISRSASEIEIENHEASGGSRIYVTVDGTDPTLGGKQEYGVPPSAVRTIQVNSLKNPRVVKVASSGTPTYSVVPKFQQ